LEIIAKINLILVFIGCLFFTQYFYVTLNTSTRSWDGILKIVLSIDSDQSSCSTSTECDILIYDCYFKIHLNFIWNLKKNLFYGLLHSILLVIGSQALCYGQKRILW